MIIRFKTSKVVHQLDQIHAVLACLQNAGIGSDIVEEDGGKVMAITFSNAEPDADTNVQRLQLRRLFQFQAHTIEFATS